MPKPDPKTTEKPPRCPMRVLNCGRYEIETEPPAVPRISACTNPDCDLTIRAYGEVGDAG